MPFCDPKDFFKILAVFKLNYCTLYEFHDCKSLLYYNYNDVFKIFTDGITFIKKEGWFFFCHPPVKY